MLPFAEPIHASIHPPVAAGADRGCSTPAPTGRGNRRAAPRRPVLHRPPHSSPSPRLAFSILTSAVHSMRAIRPSVIQIMRSLTASML